MNTCRQAVAAFLLGSCGPAFAAPAAQPEIDQLLAALGDSPCEMFRDGQWLEGPDAQADLRERSEGLAGQFASTEDFIAAVASGPGDQIRCPGEEAQPAAAWLRTRLKLIRR